MDIEEIKRRKLLELQKKLQEEQAKQEQLLEMELQKKALLKKILTPEARERLERIRMARPEFAAAIELQLIQLAQLGRLKIPLTDEEFKALLEKIASAKRKREIKIVRK
ncbi:DNA-binding protein [Methanocaldococcus infernus]|uniref:DNA-binding protein Metin_0366 n=1 Tax=Methanocaldococcus infernus (strain DSM 11812 / JCM 15783 / ME) TaxID=573063 RepID=D5VR33_METIM|nr:DNA-binding protein [Methanocaldococcus infernus]ADG13036.1 DNA-binding TFAR19-related protein [Methanocaldococcus infernus ME]